MAPLLLAIFLDAVAIGLTFAVIPPMILQTGEYAFLSDTVPLSVRGIWLSLIIICYTVGQFFCSPILGYISHKKGQKNTILSLLFLSIIAYAIGTLSVLGRSISLLFLYKIIVGVSTSGKPIFQTYLTQTAAEDRKAQLYGWVNALSGLGFITGSFLTQIGVKTYSLLDRCVLFFSLGISISLINYFIILKKLPESPRLIVQEQGGLQKGFLELKNLLKHPSLQKLFIAVLFYFISWELFYTFIPLFLIQKLDMLAEETTHFYTMVHFWSFIGNSALEHWTGQYTNRKIVLYLIPVWCGLLFLEGFIAHSLTVWIGVALIASIGAVLNCSLSALLTDQVESHNHGSVLGIFQALQCIARLLPSLFLASFLINYPAFSFQWSAFAFLCSGYLVWKISPNNRLHNRVYE